MSGAFYAIFVIGILVVIHWYIVNERMGQNSDGGKGLLAMKAAPEGEADAGVGGQAGRMQRPEQRQAAVKSKPNR